MLIFFIKYLQNTIKKFNKQPETNKNEQNCYMQQKKIVNKKSMKLSDCEWVFIVVSQKKERKINIHKILKKK